MKAIVTIKLEYLPIRKATNNKVSGGCPLLPNRFCTDMTGNHHSYIEEGKDIDDISQHANKKHGHITRIEVIQE